MKLNRVKKIILLILVAAICLVLGILAMYHSMPTTFAQVEYDVNQSGMNSSSDGAHVRIVHLSDVHNKEYGTENVDLMKVVEDASPDLIFITGDLVDRNAEDITPMIQLIEELKEIAPVYYSYGNHEMMNQERFGNDIGAQVEAVGGIVLDYVYQDVDIRGEQLRIGGIYGYCVPEKYLETNEASVEECDFLREFQNTDRTTLLLTHMPYAWLDLDGLNEWDVDIIFSGHSHGGQVELPLFGPVYAPDQGWFPDRVSGKFVSDDGSSTLIVSRGLGDSVKLPRVNNPWEMVIVDVVF